MVNGHIRHAHEVCGRYQHVLHHFLSSMPSLECESTPQLLYRWDPTFDTPQSVSSIHYEPYVKLGDDDTVSSSIDPIYHFMQAFDGDDSCHHATDMVMNFCKGANLSNLQLDESATTELVAILNNSDVLTAQNLFKALVEAENLRIRHTQGIGNDSSTSLPIRHVQIDESNTQIRRMYIENLNRWTILVLAATIPDHQASIVSEFIFNHLQFDSLIKAKTIHNGLPAFALEFHLPYFALRRHRLPRKDKRRGSNDKESRQYHDITFLRTMDGKADNSLTEYVYEAKVSCLVTGLCRYSWSAYLLNDLYFETEDESNGIAEYHAQQGSMQPALDPLSAGKKHLDTVPREPREYFLFIFRIWIGKIGKEWKQLFAVTDEAIQTYKTGYWTKTGRGVSPKRDRQYHGLDADGQRTRSREELHEWMRRTTELLRRFIGSLDQLIMDWAKFRTTGFNYFKLTDNPARLGILLTEIEQDITDLERLLPKFKHTLGCLNEDMSRDVNLIISHESNESALFQQKTARDVKVLTWITFLTLPFTLSSGLLSMQEGFIPINRSPQTSMALLAVVEALVWLILGTLRGWNWVKVKFEWARFRFGVTRECTKDFELRQLEG